jgi:glycosyltransferase involved in cell wall biosynthesis
MKHILILRQSEPYPYGWIRNLSRAFIDNGYEVTVAVRTAFGLDAAEKWIDGVRVLRYKEHPGGKGLMSYLGELLYSMFQMGRLAARAAGGRRIDVVIASTPPDPLVLVALPLRWRGAALVVDQRDPSPELYEAKFQRRGLPYRLLVWMERFAFRRADVAVVHNESCADIARHRAGLPDDRIYVVGVGPDPERIFPVEARPELKRGKRHMVLWMGNMSTQESLGHLIDAAEELVLRRQRSDVMFAIVGPGDARETLMEDVERRGLRHVVHFPGVVTDDSVLRAYLATADVCVSVDERNEMNDKSTMMKVLEYMAMGRAIVQFPLLEMERAAGDTTVYARNADSADLAQKIAELLDDPERRHRLGQAARARVLQGQMWDAQIPVALAAVEAAVGRRAR